VTVLVGMQRLECCVSMCYVDEVMCCIRGERVHRVWF